MARLPTPGSDNGTWGGILNDFLSQSHNSDGSLKLSAVSASGGAATDASVVHNTGAETIAGVKTFSSAPVVPSASFPESAVTNLTTNLSSKIDKSTATTKGDLFAATTASTIVRVGVGTDGQILTADNASSPGVKWAAAPTPPVTSVVGQTGVITGAQIAGDGALTGTYVPKARATFPSGRIVGWAGASTTNGSSSSNTTVYSFRVAVNKISGSARVAGNSINGGVPSETSTQITARIGGIITSGAQIVVICPDFGTNSAGSSITLAQFQTDIITCVTTARASGVPVIICTTLPRGSSAAASIHILLQTYNLWLRAWAPVNGVPLADTFGAVVDRTTGYLAAAYDSGDGTHPNDAGHLAIAQAIAPQINALYTLPPWPVQSPEPGIGLIANPLIDGAGPNTWTNLNGSFASPTFSIVNSSGSDGLPAGRWQAMQLDGVGTGGSGYRNMTKGISSSGWAVGDTLLCCSYVKCSDANGVGLKLQWLNSSTAGIGIILETSLTGTPGPIMSKFVIPAGTTGLYLALSGSATSAQNVTFYIGATQVYNLTTLGLASAF
ncbi:SGNH/GDSL hydrolase family protein [Candidatus Saccharibacteria bacterium]|nr:SGNH/GDSL hydrolase family protein [Candidatus Saccharibacteria bacterium]MBI3338394.1 SGNH/GDSL hydrolase family protein [Candidatus Saccharibacteria bacterium]